MKDEIKLTAYELLQKLITDDYNEDFINYFHDYYCIPECGVECNDHYIEGAEIKDILGCCILHYTNEIDFVTMANTIIEKVNDDYYWNNKKWIKIK